MALPVAHLAGQGRLSWAALGPVRSGLSLITRSLTRGHDFHGGLSGLLLLLVQLPGVPSEARQQAAAQCQKGDQRGEGGRAGRYQQEVCLEDQELLLLEFPLQAEEKGFSVVHPLQSHPPPSAQGDGALQDWVPRGH